MSLVRFRVRAPLQLPVKSSPVKQFLSNPAKSTLLSISTSSFVCCNQYAAKGIIRGTYRSITRMPLIMKLNARQIETAKPKEKTYKLADGGG
ncbi:hypothetical protein, partial [Xenorhabdus khoisanae]|uniref:hypothetical protein n=1 Tax=Xenorhabdus khoisanae TaxID=880157 RepID=UPI00128E81B2